jgi:hypothetical protein
MMIQDRPHWETRFPEEVWPFFTDFRNALVVIWDHLGLPNPTKAQLEIAHRLQYGADSIEWSMLSSEEKTSRLNDSRSDIIRCYRGIGKSYITAAFVTWCLARNPRDEKILVVSATANKSKAFVSQVKNFMYTHELLQWMLTGPREGNTERRDQSDRFDVAYSSLTQSTSVRAASITGQVTGDRATKVVADDIEIPQNSGTEDARERILQITREFDAIIKTEHGRGDVFELGTPQTEESVYNKQVAELGYTCFTIPVRFPAPDKIKNYSIRKKDSDEKLDILAFFLRDGYSKGTIRPHDLVDPERFTSEELVKEETKGKAYFALQYMLDTSLSDAERYPLRQKDLIVMSLNALKAPLTVQWGHDTDKKNYIQDISNMGFAGDHFLRPLMVDPEWSLYDGSVLFLDPAGRGKDELAWAVVKSLNGMLFIADIGGHRGDSTEGITMALLSAKKHNVNTIQIEPNFGGGMFATVLKGLMQSLWPGGCSVEEAPWASSQKELRIIETLEPAMSTHRLVIDETLVRNEAKMEGEDLVYSLLYQLTHITRDRGSLKHDDRLDALAGAVAYFMQTVGQDTEDAAKGYRESKKDALIARFINMVEDKDSGGGPFTRGRSFLEEPEPGEECWDDDDYPMVYSRTFH